MALQDYSTALVTGASSGIGEAIARKLTERNLVVHAAARREDKLDALAAQTGCIKHVLDVRDTKAIYEHFADLPIDILVNNAGVGRGYEQLISASTDDIDATLGTNVTAAVHVLRAVVPGMVERRRGHVVNIGSVAGLYPIQSSIYGASKGAIRLLAQNLRMELQGSGVRATEICPGRVKTEFFGVAIGDPVKSARAFADLQPLTPTDVANAILYALDTPWHVNVNSIELAPIEQTFGGDTVAPFEGDPVPRPT